MAIVTVTLNPALDLETQTDHLVPGQKLRCAEPRRDPGGGGINVARAIKILGGEATAAMAVGGPIGTGLAELLRAADIPVAELPAPGGTRQNLSVIETSTGHQFRFIFPGPAWTEADLAATTAALQGVVSNGDLVILSGSLPPGLSADQLLGLARDLQAMGSDVVADTSGAALALLSEAGAKLRVLRMDSEEAETLIGHALPDRADTAAMAQNLVHKEAADIVIVARGADGSILATADGAWFAPAVPVEVASVTGAGDSFVGGAMLALSRGAGMDEVLQWGCAAASAACTTEATELCNRATFERLLPLSAAKRL